MRQRRLFLTLVGAAAVTCACFVWILPSSASDHADTPRTILDPEGDIADVYAFMRPNPIGGGNHDPSDHLVLVMNTKPGADASTFSGSLDYTFDVREVLSVADAAGPNVSARILKVVCTFNRPAASNAAQFVNCNANGATFRNQEVNVVDDGQDADARPLRVYAGLRSDPAFLDRKLLEESVAAGSSKFVGSGTNAYAGQNVLSLVVEVEIGRFLNPNDASAPIANPILAVSGEIRRR